MLTVGDWLAHWLASRTAPAASTVRGYTAHVRLYLVPYLGPVLLAELSAGHVQAMFTAITRQHRELGSPVTPATLNRIRATLRYPPPPQAPGRTPAAPKTPVHRRPARHPGRG